MKRLLDKYLENQIKLDDLKRRYLKADCDILENIKSVSYEQKLLFFENEDILNKTVYYYKKTPSLIDDDIFLLLLEFSKKLTGNNNHKDNTINYEIQTLLFDYAKKVDNLNFIVQAGYYKGMSIFNLNRRDHLELVECFDVVEKYSNCYFSLDKETRLIFNKSINNLFMAYNINRTEDYHTPIAYAKKALEFWELEDVRNFDPDFPYDTFIFATRRNITAMLDVFRNSKVGIVEKEIKEMILESANYVYERYEKHSKETLLPLDSLCVYSYHASRYHLGLISLENLIDELEKISYPIDDDYYGMESKSRMIRITTYLLFYMDFEGIQEKYQKKKKEIMERANDYIFKMEISSFESILRRDLEVYLQSLVKRLEEKEAIDSILNIMLLRHLPTYIHSKMVALLATKILEETINTIPTYFVGIWDLKNSDDVKNAREKLVDVTVKSSLLHDIGKLFYVNEISNFGRKLTNSEFDYIKGHTSMGYELLKESNISKDYIEASLFHHFWCDGTNGYPKLNQTIKPSMKQITDIISIADSIDAATDQLGRPYAKVKGLSELLAELKKESRTRYSNVIVDLILSDEKLKNKIEYYITEERKNITIKAIEDFNNR